MGKFNRNMFLLGLGGFFILSVICFFAIYTAVPNSGEGLEILPNNANNSNTVEETPLVNNNYDKVDDFDTSQNYYNNTDQINITNETEENTVIDDVQETNETTDVEEETVENSVTTTSSATSSTSSTSSATSSTSSTSSATSSTSSTSSATSSTSSTSSATSSTSSTSSNTSSTSSTSSATSSTSSTSSSTSSTASTTGTASTQNYVQLPSVSSTSNGSDTVSIIAAGDNLIHTGIYSQAEARATEGYYFDPAYANVKDYIKNADLASVNQETVMSKSNAPSSYPLFNTPVEMADTLKNLGFDVVSLANNHAGDKGATGMYETLDLLKNEKDLTVVGSYFNQSDYNNIPVFEVNGIKVSYVAATQWTNDIRVPTNTGLVTSYIEGEAEVKVFLEQIAKAKSLSDIVVVNIHWGFENTLSVNSFQTGLAQRLVASGADIIIGHHPHVLQPVEFIEKADGSYAVCYYSVGNLISAQNYGERMIGGLADVTIAKVDGKAVIVDAQLIPIITHYGSNYANIGTYSYDNYTSQLANTHGVKEMNTPSFSMDYIYRTVTNAIDKRFLPDEFISMYGGTSYSNAS